MNVTFASVEKRINSTFVPQYFSQLYQCILKDSCSILQPIISLDIGLLSNPSQYNYAFIPDFSRYYYIKDWTFDRGLWNATLEVDVLASHKSDILGSSAYVIRCSKYSDGNIIDTFYPAKTQFDSGTEYWVNGNKHTPWASTLTEGMYVVGIINDDDSSMGGVSYYGFTPSQFATLKHALLSDATWTDIETTNPDLGLNLYKSLFNPFQYIASINWFPFSVVSQGDLITSISFGWWTLPGINCYRLGTFLWAVEKLIPFHPHGEAYLRGNYLNCAPYSSYTLYAPPFGEIELDASKFAMATYTSSVGNILCNINVDLISGQGILTVYVRGDPDVLVCRITTQIAITIQMAQLFSEHDVGSTISSTINAGIQEAKTFASAFGSTQPAIESIINAVKNARKTVSELKAMSQMVTDANSVGSVKLAQIGSNGSIAQFNYPFALVWIHKDVVVDDEFEFGRPYCHSGELSHFSPGYVLTLNAHIYSSAYAPETELINSFLNGGVFLE